MGRSYAMKTTVSLYILIFFLSSKINLFSQNTSSLFSSIKALDSAKTTTQYIQTEKQFVQLSSSQKNNWLPYYYSALCDILIAFEKKGKEIDVWCNKADFYIRIADSLSPNNSEILVLKSMSNSARIQLNPVLRGNKYGSQAKQLAEQAIQINSHNPRAYLQKAMAIYYTPEKFGGGAQKAKPVFETAIEKFKLYKLKDKLYPNWGEDRAQKLLNEIISKTKR